MGGFYSKVVHAAAGDLENVYNRRDMPAGLSTPDCRLVTNRLLDPRSVTLGIKRTPLIFNKEDPIKEEEVVQEKKLLETDIDTFVDPSTTPTGVPRRFSKSPAERNLSLQSDNLDESNVEGHDGSDPASVSLSDVKEADVNEVIVEEEVSIIEEVVTTVEEVVSSVDELDEKMFNDVLVIEDSPVKEGAKLVKAKLISTPDCYTPDNTPTKPSVRTPLALVSQNASHGKLWRGIQEERKYRGLRDAENTPPAFKGPLPEVIQSAPAQIHNRHRKGGGRHAIVWDENTLVI